ncbi:ergosterol biosynthesis protein-like protein Erg28 [Parathielavia appendiculata]|uniref:Ergosterol biosynthesis protein-like protein Erg28 n=1 Tax=Parathielavia appendiculata TaxID=2587402 RepID=A0AAN6YZ01_9PEZI|nr:ergosterol biosynthesis protein-like protein Erg28 [Parathielavia appendiculata]
MATILPSSIQDGYLPYLMLYTSVAGIAHTAWCYLSKDPASSMRMFRGPRSPTPTPLLAHVYAVKNLYTSVIRLYAVYHLNNRPLYNLAMLSYAGVLWLYFTEYAIWQTARGSDTLIPLATSGLGLVWMWVQSDWYLR